MKKISLYIIILISSLLLTSCKTGIMLENNKVLKIDDNYLPWTIKLAVDDMEILIRKSGDYDKYVSLSTNNKTVTISMFVEPAYLTDKPQEYRNIGVESEKTLFPSSTGIIKTNTPEYAQAELLVPKIGSFTINQYHIRRHYIKDGFWIDFHVSIIDYSNNSKDREFLLSIMDSLKFIPKTKEISHIPEVDSLTYAVEYFANTGLSLLLTKDITRARKCFEKAREIEMKLHVLDEDKYLIVLKSLGLLYLQDENPNLAVELLNYAVSLYPDEGVLYYYQAIAYANSNDLDNTIKSLQNLAEHLDSWNDERKPPKSLGEKAFKKFMTNEKFIAAMKNIGY